MGLKKRDKGNNGSYLTLMVVFHFGDGVYYMVAVSGSALGFEHQCILVQEVYS